MLLEATRSSKWSGCRPLVTLIQMASVWLSTFLPVRVLSRVFRGKFLARLRAAFDRGKLSFHGQLAALADPGEFRRRLAAVARTEWVVYAKPPFGGPDQVLKYLARYTHRVAISNRRLLALEDGEVTFRWKDYAHGGRPKTMTLKAVEFLRRFLLHVLPAGVVRIGTTASWPTGCAGRSWRCAAPCWRSNLLRNPSRPRPPPNRRGPATGHRRRTSAPPAARPDGDRRDRAGDPGASWRAGPGTDP